MYPAFARVTTHLDAIIVLWIAGGGSSAAIYELQNISGYRNAIGRYARDSLVLYGCYYRLTRICTEVLGLQDQRRNWPLYI